MVAVGGTGVLVGEFTVGVFVGVGGIGVYVAVGVAVPTGLVKAPDKVQFDSSIPPANWAAGLKPVASVMDVPPPLFIL